jgi:protein TonB
MLRSRGVIAACCAGLGLACATPPTPARLPDLTSCDDPSVDLFAPVVRAHPLYPRRAYERGIEGEVIVSYAIGADGRPRGVEVVRAEPPGVFEDAAVATVSRWRFCPPSPDAEPDAPRVETKIRFDLSL